MTTTTETVARAAPTAALAAPSETAPAAVAAAL